MTTKTPQDLEAIRTRLVAMREEVETLSKGHAHDTDTVEVDSAMGRLSRMDALQQQALAQEAARRRDLELKHIDTALQRLDDGSFGECAVCGEDIGEKRLELDPTVAICINCARQGEH